MKKTAQEILKELLEHTKQNANSFATEIGTKSQNIYDIEDGTTKNFTAQMSKLIVDRFKDVNREYLLDRVGQLLKNNKTMEDEIKPLPDKQESGTVTLRTLNRLLDDSSKLVDTNHILAISNQELCKSNYEQTLMIKQLVIPNKDNNPALSNLGVPLAVQMELEILDRFSDQLAAGLAGKDLWKTKTEGLSILGRFLVGYRSEIAR